MRIPASTNNFPISHFPSLVMNLVSWFTLGALSNVLASGNADSRTSSHSTTTVHDIYVRFRSLLRPQSSWVPTNETSNHGVLFMAATSFLNYLLIRMKTNFLESLAHLCECLMAYFTWVRPVAAIETTPTIFAFRFHFPNCTIVKEVYGFGLTPATS